MTAPTRTVAVALSADALLYQWARQSAAPAGAAVVAHTEIAARRRGGIEWRSPHAIAVSVLGRPATLVATAAEVSWLAASLAAARALDESLGGRRLCQWPDAVVDVADDALDVAVTASCTLGPGRVEYAALTIRLGPVELPDKRAVLTRALLGHLRTCASGLDEPSFLVDSYKARCATLGHAVELRLLPHGTMRGHAEDIDESGQLVLSSPTGLREHVAVAAINSVELLPDL